MPTQDSQQIPPLPVRNLVRGQLADGTSCAIVDRSSVDEAEAVLLDFLGRTGQPGELFAAMCRQLKVDRLVTVVCPPQVMLAAVLEVIQPGVVLAPGGLPRETLRDLLENDFRILPMSAVEPTTVDPTGA